MHTEFPVKIPNPFGGSEAGIANDRIQLYECYKCYMQPNWRAYFPFFFFHFFHLVSFCIHNFTIVRAASIQVIRNIRMERRHTVIESWSRRGHANIQTVHYVQVCRWERLQKEHFNRIYRAFPFYGAPIHLWKAPFQFREFSSIRRVAGMVVAVEWWSSSSLFPSDR